MGKVVSLDTLRQSKEKEQAIKDIKEVCSILREAADDLGDEALKKRVDEFEQEELAKMR